MVCEMAVESRCRCRCGGRAHRLRRLKEILTELRDFAVGALDSPEIEAEVRKALEALPSDDPHRIETAAERRERRRSRRPRRPRQLGLPGIEGDAA